MQRVLAVLLVLLGVAGLVLGRLGETVWAPATERTATVELSEPGPAVLIDPGVLYVGGQEGEVTITGASEVSLITAPNGDIEAWLGDSKYTRVTGLSDWQTITTEEVNPEGPAELPAPTTSDLWRSVDTAPSPVTIDVAEFAAQEHGANEQMYRAILVVTDGTAPGAESISITWPVDAKNEWVPYAYAAGATLAVIGLVLLVVSVGSRRREREDDAYDEDRVTGELDDADRRDAENPTEADGVAPVLGSGSAAAAAAGGAAATRDADADPSPASEETETVPATEPELEPQEQSEPETDRLQPIHSHRAEIDEDDTDRWSRADTGTTTDPETGTDPDTDDDGGSDPAEVRW